MTALHSARYIFLGLLLLFTVVVLLLARRGSDV
jgi:hypothetical protein